MNGNIRIKVFKFLEIGKKKLKKSAIKDSIISPYKSWVEKKSKFFLFLFVKIKPNGVNIKEIKKEFKITAYIKLNEKT